MGASFSLYPRVALGYGSESYEFTAFPIPVKFTDTYFYGSLYAPVLAHVATHVFVGFGPSIEHEFTRTFDPGGDNRSTSIGAGLVVGGWL
jgi:hypothetical protein